MAIKAVGVACVGLASIAGALTPASAQEAIATAARGSDGAVPNSPGNDTFQLNDRFDDGPGFLRSSGPCGGPQKTADGKTDKTPHGQVWAGVGTNGYREIGGVACLPLSGNAAVTIAIDAGRINGWGRRR